MPGVTGTNHSPCRNGRSFRRKSLPIPSLYKWGHWSSRKLRWQAKNIMLVKNISSFISEDFCLLSSLWLFHIYVHHLPPIFPLILFLAYLSLSVSPPLISPSLYSTISSQLLEIPPLPRDFPLLLPNHPLNSYFNKLPTLISLQIILCHFAIEPVSWLKWKFPKAHNK